MQDRHGNAQLGMAIRSNYILLSARQRHAQLLGPHRYHYEHMTPSLAPDRVMEPAEAIGGLARVAPARHAGLMAANRKAPA
jgi:hypothetical protein